MSACVYVCVQCTSVMLTESHLRQAYVVDKLVFNEIFQRNGMVAHRNGSSKFIIHSVGETQFVFVCEENENENGRLNARICVLYN